MKLICCLLFLNGIYANTYSVVKLFQKYVQIDSTTNSDLAPAVEFWNKLAVEEKLPFTIYEYKKGYPVVVIKWRGSNSSLSSVMLNSHIDVVPADEKDGWDYPPFAAHIDDMGYIYGRGTQDMKCLSIQQFEALRRLRQKKVPLLRDVYMTLMPDEETGGHNGMKNFIKSKQFAAMNVGVEMDEGWAQSSPTSIPVFVKDKAVWQFQVDCYGIAAHGALVPPANATAVGKCLNFANQMYVFRENQAYLTENWGMNNAGKFTSVNLNVISGGTSVNTIPNKVSFTFDVRLGAEVDENQFLDQLNQWIKRAGDNLTLTFLVKDQQTPRSVTDDSSPHWRALMAAASKMNVTLEPIVTAGATDGRHFRAIGVPSYGLSPMLNNPILAHKVNERLNIEDFLKGVDIYEEIVKQLANTI